MGDRPSKAERARDAANETYFVVLAESRASLVNLPMMALVTMFVVGIETLVFLSTMVFYQGYRALSPLYYAHLIVLGLSALVFVVSLCHALVFRFQVFFSGLMAAYAVIWVYMVSLLGIGLAASAHGPEGVTFPGTSLAIWGALGLLYVCGATVVHVFLLRKRLREGHSEARTWGNLVAASSVYSSKSMWIIFGAVAIVPNVLTQGHYVVNTIGVVIFLFLAAVMPSLPVEFTYLTYLKSRDKKYWDFRPPKRRRRKGRGRAVFKKIALWVGIFIAVCVAFGTLAKILEG